MVPPFGQTIDGLELQFGINYVGHFALITRIELLLAQNGRLVVLSPQAHRVADIDLDAPNFEQQACDSFPSVCHAVLVVKGGALGGACGRWPFSPCDNVRCDVAPSVPGNVA